MGVVTREGARNQWASAVGRAGEWWVGVSRGHDKRTAVAGVDKGSVVVGRVSPK